MVVQKCTQKTQSNKSNKTYIVRLGENSGHKIRTSATQNVKILDEMGDLLTFCAKERCQFGGQKSPALFRHPLNVNS